MKNNSFGEVLVDINIRPPYFCDDVIKFAFNNATVVKISDEELSVITKASYNEEASDCETTAKKLKEVYKNLKLIVITMGEKGSYSYDCVSKKGYICSATKTDVVSTVGAGDSFIAAFMSQYLKGQSIEKCLQYGSKVSAFVVSQMGAVPDYEAEDLITLNYSL